MAQSENEIEISTGRRDGDGRVRVSVFAEGLLALEIEGHGERTPTLLLTVEQARRLRDALEELIQEADVLERKGDETIVPVKWDGEERRTTGELR